MRVFRLATLVSVLLGCLVSQKVDGFSPVGFLRPTSVQGKSSKKTARTTIPRISPHLKAQKKPQANDDFLNVENDALFDGQTTLTLVAGQSALVAGAALAAAILKTPNYGLGPGIVFSSNAFSTGLIFTVPLLVLAAILELVEDKVPALQEVTMATQRSVLHLLGGKFKPALGLVVSLALGLAAGFGEEMLFRGVMQYELANRFGAVLSVGATSIVFGLLHAVTPLYAVLATAASVYFGFLYQSTGNLAVPIVTHAAYDLGALLWAHWTVSKLTESEQEDILNWKGPGEN